jgi:hypothetical protein
MPQHSNGKVISQPRDRNIWRLDPELWSANRAEHRFADGHELVCFRLPAANGYPATIGWSCSAGLDSMTLVASGQAASLREARLLRGGAGSGVGGSRMFAEGLSCSSKVGRTLTGAMP